MKRQLSGGSGGGKAKTLFSSSGAHAFIELSDAPSDYTGEADKVLVVKHDESGLEFVPGRGVADGFASLDGTVKIPAAQIPSIAITEYLGTAVDQTAMLALTGEKGDWCIRTDLSTVWVITGDDPSVIGDWTSLVYPADPGKVLVSATDTTSDYLESKVTAGTAIDITKNNPAGNENLEIGVSLGTQSDQACAGNDDRLLYPQKPILSFEESAPGTPSEGDRYVILSGSYIDHVYEYISGSWVTTAPVAGMFLYAINDGYGDYKGTKYYYYSGGGWFQINDGRVLADGADANTGYLFEKITDDGIVNVTLDTLTTNHKVKISVATGTQSDQAAAGNDTRFEKVKTSALDPAVGYLVAKLEAGIATLISEDTTNPLDYKAKIDVSLGTQSDQACAGDDIRLKFWIAPVKSIFDNTVALPVGPSTGDRYIAKVTANGWTINNVYEWSGSAWVATAVDHGMTVYNRGENFVRSYYIPGEGAQFWAHVVSQVLADVTDEIPGPLYTKLAEGTAITLAVDDSATSHVLDVSVNLGTQSDQACAGNDARLSDSRTPTSHALAGALHSTDTITNVNTKLTDGSLITSKSAEISALTEKTAVVGADLVMIEDSAATNAKKKVQVSKLLIFPQFQFFAEQFLSPNNADWTVNALAPASADTLNNALTIRAFDDTTEEGIGFLLELPETAIGMTLFFRSRAQTAPGSTVGVVPQLYTRQVTDNTAIGAWSAATALTALSIPNNARFQYDYQTISFATLGLVAGDVTLFELTRKGTATEDTLSGDWNLLELKVTFY